MDAVRRWQRAVGLPPTGAVDASQIVYGAGPLRIDQYSVRVGDPASGPILSTTGTEKVVTVPVRVTEAGWAVAGAAVTVQLPDGRTVAGVVETVGTDVATGEPSGGTDPVGQATIPVTVTIADQAALTTFERAPVTVRYVVLEHRDVLAVPVVALVALAEGGYGLQVVDQPHHYIPVQVGLFADGFVEVSGPGVHEGLPVELPI